jgi:hypothetical protein
MNQKSVTAIKKLCLPGRPITFKQLQDAGATAILTTFGKLKSAGHDFSITTYTNNWLASVAIKLDNKEIETVDNATMLGDQ